LQGCRSSHVKATSGDRKQPTTPKETTKAAKSPPRTLRTLLKEKQNEETNFIHHL
jgi:hypothetical protein